MAAPDDVGGTRVPSRAFRRLPLARRGAAPRTLEAYQRDLARFVEYAAGKGIGAPADITSKMLREYVYHLKDLGLSPSSIRRNVSALRTYFRFLIGEGHGRA